MVLGTWRGKELNKFFPQTEAATFAFSSVFMFLLWQLEEERAGGLDRQHRGAGLMSPTEIPFKKRE